jgi:spore coat protein U-like protein
MRYGVSRASLLAAVFVSVALASVSARADACKLESVGGINFGNYDPLSSTTLHTVGSFGYGCPPGQGGPEITISPGLWGTFASRAMQNPGDPVGLLQYNLYLEAACLTVWGDGTNGTSTQIGPAGRGQTIPVYACMPPLQNVSAGTFSDTVVVTFNF